jgi:ribosome modulation factor
MISTGLKAQSRPTNTAGPTAQQHPRAPVADVPVAAFEAGWDDGHEQFERHKRYSA